MNFLPSLQVPGSQYECLTTLRISLKFGNNALILCPFQTYSLLFLQIVQQFGLIFVVKLLQNIGQRSIFKEKDQAVALERVQKGINRTIK